MKTNKDKPKREVRIPIPGTPAFIVQTVAGETEEQQRDSLNHDQKGDKVQLELDEELADTFPASDPLSAAQPQPCPEGTERSPDSGECEKDDEAA